MSTNGKLDQMMSFVPRAEFEQGMEEQVSNIIDAHTVINELKRVLNIHAEILGCHRYMLEKFMPAPLLEQAAKEYKALREAQIASEANGPAEIN